MSPAGNPILPGTRDGADGFTLLEALVAVAIVALIGGLAFPSVDRMLDGARFASARTSLAGVVAAARAQAVRTDAAVVVEPSPDRRSILADGRSALRLPAETSVQASAPLRFHGDGSAVGGSLVVADRRRRAVLDVSPDNGALRWRA